MKEKRAPEVFYSKTAGAQDVYATTTSGEGKGVIATAVERTFGGNVRSGEPLRRWLTLKMVFKTGVFKAPTLQLVLTIS